MNRPMLFERFLAAAAGAAGMLFVMGTTAWSEEPEAVSLVADAPGAHSAVPAADEKKDAADKDEKECQCQTLTEDWFGAGEKMAESGLSLRLSATQVWQDVARGGLATHRHAGRYSGTYDLEIELDLEKAARVPGGSLYILAEGGWSDGIDPPSVGSLFGVNANAFGDRSIQVSEFRYEQSLMDDRVLIRVGKLDLTGGFECKGCAVAFDGNAFANDETAQFLNGALVNNPTIPFSEPGIGAVVMAKLTDSWYVAAGMGDSRARAGTTGFGTAFDGGNHFLYIYETGYVAEPASCNGPLPGAYRIGLWHEPPSKPRFDGGSKHNDVGFYVSMDQMLYREKGGSDGDDEGPQGLGAFTRFGFADADTNPVKFFWSGGCQYRGLVPGRNADVLGVGVAQGRLTADRDAGFTASHETVAEVYYNIEVVPGLNVSPHVQFVANPGGLREVSDAVIVGFRVQAAF